jgi:hypothetical protein
MATDDPEFYQAPKFSPEYDEYRPKQRGCFFYGCVIASVLAVLLIVALAVGAYMVYRKFNQLLEDYTATAPRELPKLEVDEEEREAVVDRFKAFRDAIKNGTATEPLVLTEDDLNALIEEVPELKGRVHFTVEGDKIKGQVSIPLSVFMDTNMTRGRYLNGEAEFEASLSDGVLVVRLDSLEVNGRRPPEEVMANLRQQNLAKDFYKDPDNAEMIRRFESLEIKDGKIIIKPRPRSEPKPDRGQSKSPTNGAPVTKKELPGAEAPDHGSPKPEPNPRSELKSELQAEP